MVVTNAGGASSAIAFASRSQIMLEVNLGIGRQNVVRQNLTERKLVSLI